VTFDAMLDAIAGDWLKHRQQARQVVRHRQVPLTAASDTAQAMRRARGRRAPARADAQAADRGPGMAIRTSLFGIHWRAEQDHRQLMEFVEGDGFDAMGVCGFTRGGRSRGRGERPKLAVAAEIKKQPAPGSYGLVSRDRFEQADFLAEQFDERNPTVTTACRWT